MTRISDPKFPFQNHVTGFLIQLSDKKSVKVLPLGKSKVWDESVEFHLHFKLSILFLDASTVQDDLQKTQHLRHVSFPPFLFQNKRYFNTGSPQQYFLPFSYIMKMQSKYEQKLTHHKKEQKNTGRSYAPALVQANASCGYHQKPWFDEPPLSQSSFHPVLFVHETIYRAALQLRVG